MNDDLELLASAYLDGDVTPEQRAQVEASTELGAEVERLRQVRAVLGALDPPAISMRERHLAAALDAWDRLPDAERTGAARDRTPVGVIAPPRPTALDRYRRNRIRAWTMTAAAGLIVVIAGGIVLNAVGNGSDDDTASVAPLGANDAPAAEEFDLDEQRREVDASDEALEEIAADAAPPLALEPVADDAEPLGGAEAPPPEQELANLTSLDDLALFAASATDATTSQVDAPASTDSPSAGADGGGFDVRACPGIDTVVGPALYNGVVVIVGIDESRNEAVANSAEDCSEIARARLP